MKIIIEDIDFVGNCRTFLKLGCHNFFSVKAGFCSLFRIHTKNHIFFQIWGSAFELESSQCQSSPKNGKIREDLKDYRPIGILPLL